MKNTYIYSWTSLSGFRQTIRNGKVIKVVSIPIKEAKKKYYETSSIETQQYDEEREVKAMFDIALDNYLSKQE